MKIAITGGAGFFGMHMANLLGEKKHHLTLIDIQPFNQNEYGKKHKYVNIDIRNKNKLDNIIKNHDIIIHAAAALPLWNKKDIYTTNVNGTENILNAAQKHQAKRVIYISSTAVYGVPKKHPIKETDPLYGVGTYGETKIEAENRCRKYIKNGLNVTIIRPKTFIGTARLGVFEILYDWIHDGKKIPIIGDGSNRYQLLDVDDLTQAVYGFCKTSNSSFNDVFNIGAGQFSTVAQDLGALISLANSGSSLLPLPAKPIKLTLKILEKLNLSPLYQWVYDTADKDSYVSIEKLKRTLKWAPIFSNADALIKSYRWYLDNYKEVKSRGSGTTHTVGWKQGALGLIKRFM